MAPITARVGGLPEAITDGVDAILIEPGDIEALTEALLRLCQDDGLRTRLGDAARARVVAQYSSEAVLPRLAAVYHAAALNSVRGAQRNDRPV